MTTPLYLTGSVSDPLNASGCCDLVAPLLSPPARYCKAGDHELLGRFPFRLFIQLQHAESQLQVRSQTETVNIVAQG